MRIYESLGGKSRGVLGCTLGVKKCFRTNVLEDDEEQLQGWDAKGGKIEIELRPYEVATFRLQLDDGNWQNADLDDSSDEDVEWGVQK